MLLLSYGPEGLVTSQLDWDIQSNTEMCVCSKVILEEFFWTKYMRTCISVASSDIFPFAHFLYLVVPEHQIVNVGI